MRQRAPLITPIPQNEQQRKNTTRLYSATTHLALCLLPADKSGALLDHAQREETRELQKGEIGVGTGCIATPLATSQRAYF